MDKTTRLEAKWIIPVSSPPLEDGVIIIRKGRIAFIGKKGDCPDLYCDEIIDCQQQIVMPGLVNPHTHLALSGLKGRIRQGSGFTDWIREVVSYTRKMSREEIISCVKRGIDELVSAGTTTIGDISRSGYSWKILKESGLRGIVYIEVIGFNRSQREKEMESLRVCAESLSLNGKMTFGVSPHSPYTLSRELLKESYGFAAERDYPVAIHIAETVPESEFIEKGTGEIRDLMIEFGLWDEGWSPPGDSSVRYLNNLGVLKGILGIHLNYVDDHDLALLKENEVSVIFCPGSNQWFGRDIRYPLSGFLERGINVALATDSLASNWRLNLFEEMHRTNNLFPQLDYHHIIEMCTINGARALNMENQIGTLSIGKYADIAIIDLPDHKLNDPEEYVVTEVDRARFTLLQGTPIQ
ncbi:MAG: amidohydrolase family protein [Nitrospinota bacterium]